MMVKLCVLGPPKQQIATALIVAGGREASRHVQQAVWAQLKSVIIWGTGSLQMYFGISTGSYQGVNNKTGSTLPAHDIRNMLVRVFVLTCPQWHQTKPAELHPSHSADGAE
jgi:hypothetical protein